MIKNTTPDAWLSKTDKIHVALKPVLRTMDPLLRVSSLQKTAGMHKQEHLIIYSLPICQTGNIDIKTHLHRGIQWFRLHRPTPRNPCRRSAHTGHLPDLGQRSLAGNETLYGEVKNGANSNLLRPLRPGRRHLSLHPPDDKGLLARQAFHPIEPAP